MKALLVVVVMVVLAACGSTGDVAGDPGSGHQDVPIPTEVPAADGPVRTRQLATVMDTGRPELCLGPVAESYPPQCGGPPMAGWDWADHAGDFDRQGEVRWGMFAVTGTFDGATFTVTGAVPADRHDGGPVAPPRLPDPAVDLDGDELAEIAERLGGDLPGAQGAYVADGHVLVDVVHDDGSLQDWADEQYGDGVVVVTSALVPAR
jgi:hypothetical protein